MHLQSSWQFTRKDTKVPRVAWLTSVSALFPQAGGNLESLELSSYSRPPHAARRYSCATYALGCAHSSGKILLVCKDQQGCTCKAREAPFFDAGRFKNCEPFGLLCLLPSQFSNCRLPNVLLVAASPELPGNCHCAKHCVPLHNSHILLFATPSQRRAPVCSPGSNEANSWLM